MGAMVGENTAQEQTMAEPLYCQASDPDEIIRFFRAHEFELSRLKRVLVEPERTIIEDVNRDRMVFEGLTFGSPALERLLKEAGAAFSPAQVREPRPDFDGLKEFEITVRFPWGQERIL